MEKILKKKSKKKKQKKPKKKRGDAFFEYDLSCYDYPKTNYVSWYA